MSLIAHAIELEPAVAGEVIAFVETKAAPQVEAYVLTKIPSVLQSVQAKLSGAAPQTLAVASASEPANVVAIKTAAPQGQRPPPPNATQDAASTIVTGGDAAGVTAGTGTTAAAPPADPGAAPAETVGSNIKIH